MAIRQEIEILRTIFHENVIQHLDSIETDTEFNIITELAQEELYTVLREDEKLPLTVVRSIALQLIRALQHLHENNIIHRDIKPQNILICTNGTVKICDFGFAKALESSAMICSFKGTPLYMAPEVIYQKPYNESADIWSLGVLLYELYTGKPPYNATEWNELVRKIKNNSVSWPKDMEPNFKGLLTGMLVKVLF